MNQNTPLARGWCAGIAPDANEDFDTLQEVSMPTAADIFALSQAYQVCTRSIRRWLKRGVDVKDPAAVLLHLTAIPHPSQSAISALTKILKSELKTYDRI